MNSAVSSAITNTRPLLCLGVVILHCTVVEAAGNATGPVMAAIASLCAMTVPAFFFISAYLMGGLHGRMTLAEYAALLRRRGMSLLLPYVLWNLIAVAIREAVSATISSPGYHFESIAQFVTDVFWAPELLPLWFLRNLICFTVAAPVLIWLVRHLGLMACVLALIVELLTPVAGLVYYVAGLYVAISGHDRQSIPCTKNAAVLLGLYAVYEVLRAVWPAQPFYDSEFVRIIINFAGICGLLAAASHMSLHRAATNQSMIFFIYGFHGIIFPYVTTLMIKMVDPHGTGAWLVELTLSLAIVVGTCVGTWYVLQKISSQLTGLLTGTRLLPRKSPL